jgi:hypothetical protein
MASMQLLGGVGVLSARGACRAVTPRACHTPGVIPASLAWLFWNVDPGAIDVVRHRDYVLDRVRSRGDLEATRWATRA